MAKCKPCSSGKHDDLCEHLACTCWCISEAVPFRGVSGLAPPPRNDLHDVLAQMNAAGMSCRTSKDGLVVFKPKPITLTDELRHLLVVHKFDLGRVLRPYTRQQSVTRPYWSCGPLEGCFSCKVSCHTIDPLGHYRHIWCGWLGQRSKLPPIKPAPLYPNMSSGSPVWGK